MMTGATILLLALAVPPPMGSRPTFDFQGQGSITVLVRTAEARDFGGVEVHAAAGLFGFGLAIGVGWERAGLDGPVRHGGYFTSGIEVRPTAWGPNDLHKAIDLHIGIGGMIGGLEADTFRAGFVTSLGADIALYPEEDHPVLTIEYRIVTPATPDNVPVYFLMLGLGFRTAT